MLCITRGQTVAGVILPKELKDLIVAISSIAHVVIVMYALQRKKMSKFNVSMAMEEEVAGNSACGNLHH
jgi:hypothetical protein